MTLKLFLQAKQRRALLGATVHHLLHVCSVFAGVVWLLPTASWAQTQTLCAKAQIQLSAQATLERQAFLATMNVQDGLPSSLTALTVNVTGSDSTGAPIGFSSDPNSTSAQFFISIQSITPAVTPLAFPISVTGSTTSTITWLIIPTVGAGGTAAGGKQYSIGATVTYLLNGQQQMFTVVPAKITVMPLPLLTVDTFIPTNVYGDNPLTPQIEPSIPFVFGMRVNNIGAGAANNLQIQNSQPTIVSNVQGLNESVKLLGCQINGMSTQPTLLCNFGNLGPGKTSVADWIMESSLTGTFSNFTASFTHAGALGGQLTSVIQSVNAYLMNHLVLLDLPGSDTIPDFLAYNTTNQLMVCSSDGTNDAVTDVSALTSVKSSSTPPNSNQQTFPLLTFGMPSVSSGFLYTSQSDPSAGTLALASVVRADGKLLNPENFWLWSNFNKITQKFDYFVALFDDNNSKGLSYTVTYGPPITAGPVFATVPTQLITVGSSYGLTVKATDPDGTIPAISLTNVPNGASFVDNKNGTGTLTWTAKTDEQGPYALAFVATETQSNGNTLTGSLSVNCTVSTMNPLQSWISQYFPGVTDPNIIGDLANPAHDGLSNLVKYALNLDPTQPIPSAGGTLGTTVVNGKHYLTLTYTHRTDDPTLVFSVISSPLANAPISNWTAQTTSIPVDQTGVPVDMETDEIQDSVAIEDGTPNRYLKLQVTQTGSHP